MKKTTAWVVSELGQPPKLQDLALAPPGPDELRLRILATGLNFADLLLIAGEYQDTPPVPFALGLECVGHVDEVGPGVAGFQPGDRVMCAPRPGFLAAHANVPAALVRAVPDSMSNEVAAGFQIAYGTSHLALRHRAHLRDSETLLVLGAAGGVGLTAVEIGKVLGARVVAVARGADKLAIAEAAGADHLIDSTEGDLLTALRAVGPIDVVYDAVGGDDGDAALRVLAPEGRYLVIGFASGALPGIKPNHLLVKNQTIIGFYWGGYTAFRPEAVSDSLRELAQWHAEGRLHPHISHVLPFEKALDGLDLLTSRKATGKVVITQ